jgi:hypothetical protein
VIDWLFVMVDFHRSLHRVNDEQIQVGKREALGVDDVVRTDARITVHVMIDIAD